MVEKSQSSHEGKVATSAGQHADERPRARRSRRTFLGAAGSLAAGAATLGKLAPAQAADSDPLVERIAAARPEPQATSQHRELRKHALRVRIQAATQQYALPIAPHASNGDEQRYANKIGSDTRGLPHDERGEVDRTAWQLAERAYASGRFEDFEAIPLGGTRKFVNPVGTLAVGLEGANVTQIAIPPAPALESAERAAEAVEQYWQSVLRDVPFASYAESADAHAAAAELSRLPGYTGPRVGGVVTPEVLFRGSVRYLDPRDRSGRTARHVVPPGVLEGPHIPQFSFREIPYGTQSIPALHRVPAPGRDFHLAHDEWLAVQDGVAPSATIPFESAPRHLLTGRDLGEYNHGTSPSVWGAALLLNASKSGSATQPGGIGAPVSPTNPYARSKTQSGSSATFAIGHLQALLSVGISRAIRATYWAKFFVHRSVRPEAFGGLVHGRLDQRVSDYPIHRDLLESAGLARAASKFGTHLLAQAYPEGAPLHGSYPAGSAATAGVAVTLLKAFYDENHVIPDPVQPDPNDPTKLIPYTGSALTVGGELNKLALTATFGRVIAGIHWRSDSAAGLAIGEAIAISILRDERLTFQEPFAGFRFTKFDGTTVTI